MAAPWLNAWMRLTDAGDATEDDEEDDDNEVAGPIAIAVDVSDAPAEGAQANDNPAL